jgi:hypothetical protein
MASFLERPNSVDDSCLASFAPPPMEIARATVVVMPVCQLSDDIAGWPLLARGPL